MHTTTAPNIETVTTADQLRTRLDKLTASHDRMRRVNSYLRNNNVRGLKEMNYTDAEIAALLADKKPHLGGGFFPTYKVNNAASKIRAVRAELVAAEVASGELPHLVEGEHYTYRHDALSVCFTFLAKPDKAARALLDRHGFMRSSGKFQYSREWSSAALRAAASVRAALDV